MHRVFSFSNGNPHFFRPAALLHSEDPSGQAQLVPRGQTGSRGVPRRQDDVDQGIPQGGPGSLGEEAHRAGPVRHRHLSRYLCEGNGTTKKGQFACFISRNYFQLPGYKVLFGTGLSEPVVIWVMEPFHWTILSRRMFLVCIVCYREERHQILTVQDSH